jgi:outer membrane protein assembly factor BamC
LKHGSPSVVAGVLLPVLLAGCGWLNDDRGLIVNRADDYLDARAAPPLELPDDLNRGAIHDTLVVPDVPQSSHSARYPNEAPRPEAIYARDEAQGIKIQKLGERRWLVVPEPPAVVWPKIKQFFADNGVAIVAEVPDAGRMQSDWIDTGTTQLRDVVRLAIRDAKAEANVATGHDRLLVRVEQGVRERSSEIHMRHENDSMAVPDEGVWPEKSAITEVEGELLNELGSYIAADVATDSVSFVARNIGAESKAVLDWDAAGAPVLHLNLDFDRAWAVLGSALTNAQVEVTDQDRANGIYFIDVAPAELDPENKPGFFGRLFGSSDKPRSFQLIMKPAEHGYLVSVLDDKKAPPPNELSQQLLLLIREFAA